MQISKSNIIVSLVHVIFLFSIIGFSLPAGNTKIIPYYAISAFLICVIFILSLKEYKVIQLQFLKFYKTFNDLYIIYSFLFFSTIPGVIFSFFIDPNYGFRNLLSLIRLVIYLFSVFFIGCLINRYNINPKKGIYLGFLITAIYNIYDFFYISSDNLIIALKGENDIGYTASIVYAVYIGDLLIRKTKINLVNFIFVCLIVFITFLSWSKSAWLIILLLTFLLLYHSFRNRKNIYFILSLIIIINAIYLFFESQILNIIITEYTSSLGSESNEERLSMMSNAFKIFLQYPFGVGNNTYPLMNEILGFKSFQYGGRPPDPHNTYLQVLVGSGILGFLSYIFSIFYLIRKAFALSSNNNKSYILVPFLAFLACFIQAFFSGITFTQPISWVIVSWLLAEFYKIHIKKVNTPII
tara:strand:+ start:2811 stop:4043 length:1233 start_codon:yes stop_codon:yes gene_type:complete